MKAVQFLSVAFLLAASANICQGEIKNLQAAGQDTIRIDDTCGDEIKSKPSSITTSDHFSYIDINQIRMYVSNTGYGSHDPRTGNGGFYWPGGFNATQTMIFQDGLVWGGKINGKDIMVNGNTYRSGLQAGKILPGGKADDPTAAKYRVYKIRKDWESLPAGAERDRYQNDYNEWPVEDGAPWVDVNGDKIYTPGTDKPEFTGDEVLWCTANDLDTARTRITYGAEPIGLEQQCTIFAFNRTGVFGDAVFKKYKLINKGGNTINDMYLAYWSDPDLGSADDDYAGCDTVLNLGFTYNGKSTDKIYGAVPPSVGYVILQGPIVKGSISDSAIFGGRRIKNYRNLPMSSFVFFLCGSGFYCDPVMGSIEGSYQFYNVFQGLAGKTGEPYTDPNTKLPAKLTLSGDPVLGKGWYEGRGFPGGPAPGDRRHVMTMGPFNMAPGDTQEVVIAILAARGTDYLNSVTVLKNNAKYVSSLYKNELLTSVKDKAEYIPREFRLEQNYPNPFNPVTTIQYALPKAGKVSLRVFDLLGREVATLVNEEKQAGVYDVRFDAGALPSGIYIYRIEANENMVSRKLTLLK